GKGSFAKVLRAIELLRPLKKIETTLMFTILKENRRQFSQIIDLAVEKKIGGVIFERFIPWGRGKAIKEEVLNREEWQDFVLRLLEFLEISFDKSIIPYKAFWVRFKKSRPYLFGAPCVAAEGGVCIMPNADVYPCRRFNLKVGNLLQEPLDKIYNGSKVLRDLKDKNKLQGLCRTCKIKSCKGCRALSFAFTGDYLAEDIQCFLEGI
ncbi:MAG: SPASM domain-containing protein, partial [Candidatus Omnitrophota bacterium]